MAALNGMELYYYVLVRRWLASPAGRINRKTTEKDSR